ncbi:MAG: CCA tRNA nucleotidyltransferase [Acidimicrobiales bacterium]
MTDPAPPDGTVLPAGATALFEESRELAGRFAAAGFRLYLVGGIVRDLFVADAEVAHVRDLDFTTDATPADVKSIVGPVAESVWNQGERFGTIAATLDGRLVEITTHRAEAYEPASRKPAVVFGTDVVDDLSRRDFTVNAMALEVTADVPQLIDPFAGRDHLRQRLLRTPRSPGESFSDDPLRMMRAARFIARLRLTPDEVLVAAVGEMRERLDVVSVERVRDEFDKLLQTPDPSAGLRFLVDSGLADRFLPELRAAVADDLDGVLGAPPVSTERLAVILRASGRADAVRRLRALRSSGHVIEEVSSRLEVGDAVAAHEGEWTAADCRRLYRRHGERLAAGLELARSREAASVATLSARLERLRASGDLDDLEPALDGDEVMAHLGIGPGRAVGEALAALLDARLERGPMTPDEARALLDRMPRPDG